MRLLLAILLGLSFALGSLAMPGGAAMAAPAAPHHEAMAPAAMGSGHCDDPQPAQQRDQRDKAAEGCCIAGCVAVAELTTPSLEPIALSALPDRPDRDRFRLGHIGEIATPPPRSA